jgi:hypothetical protein
MERMVVGKVNGSGHLQAAHRLPSPAPRDGTVVCCSDLDTASGSGDSCAGSHSQSSGNEQVARRPCLSRARRIRGDMSIASKQSAIALPWAGRPNAIHCGNLQSILTTTSDSSQNFAGAIDCTAVDWYPSVQNYDIWISDNCGMILRTQLQLNG